MNDTDFSIVAEAVRSAVHGQGLFHHLGARIDDIAPGHVVMSLDNRPELLQQHGFFHGGSVAFLVDNATTCAAGTVVNRETHTCLTAEYKINIVSPAIGDRIECTATVVKPGRSLTVVEAKVHCYIGEKDKLVAVALATIANVERSKLAK